MNHFVVARRSNDSVISVQQNNNLQSLMISNINKSAETLLEYNAHELANKPLATILHENVMDNINSYLEYTDYGTDLFDILSKTSNFSLIGKNNNVISVNSKVFRTATFNKNVINYEILIRDSSISQKLDLFRKLVLSNTKYNTHPVFNIMDEESTIKEINMILDFIHRNNLRAVIGITQIDPPHNNLNIDTLTQNTIDLLYKNIRENDITAYAGNHKVIFILLGCKSEDANSAVSRLHRNINNTLQYCSTKISIGYAQMHNEINATQILNKINNALFIAQQKPGGGSIKAANIQ